MPAARGVKRTASKASASTSTSAASKIKKKRGPTQLEIPKAPTRRGHVLTCGTGDVGQLGLGEDVMETTRFKLVTALGDKIVDAKAGGMHTIALDSDGNVWTFGCNDEGALGRPTTADGEEGAPGKVKLPEKVVAISAGDSHSAALLHNGDVYVWGSFRDSHGSMGLLLRGPGAPAPAAAPAPLPLPEPAAALASGQDHLVVLTTSGAVLTLGCGEQGQLGRLSRRSASRDARGGFGALLAPSKVTLKTSIGRVWAGYHATFALDAAGERMFAWGLNNYGQLGISGKNRKEALFSPVECDTFTTTTGVTSVAAGQHHSVALDAGGGVYTVGRVEYGRLGLGTSEDAETLTQVPALRDARCVAISAGTSNSFAVTDKGEVYGWGMGSEGQLGSGKSEDAQTPVPAVGAALKGLRVLRVAAGGQHTVILAEDPNRVETKSPTPEAEATGSEAKIEAKTEAKDKEERPRKRQKKEEVSSTTSDDAEKVNGNEKKETAMEVDETDNTTQEVKTETKKESTKASEETKMDEDPKPEEKETETEQNVDAEPETKEKPQETTSKPEETAPQPEKTTAEPEKPASQPEETPSQPEKTVSQTEGVTKPAEKALQDNDVEMAATEVNGEKEAVVTA